MLKKAILSLNMLCILSCFSLFAEPEYDIVLLAPEGCELTSSFTWEHGAYLNEAGYVGGALQMERVVPFVYNQDKGVKLIQLPKGFDRGHVTSINNHGVAVGVYKKAFQSDYYYYHPEDENVFIYNMQDDTWMDLLEHFDMTQSGLPLGSKKVERLYITDNNQVYASFSNTSYYEDEPSISFIFDLNKKTTTYLSLKTLVDVNAQGQAIGLEEDDHFYRAAKNAWFFDPQTGQQELGSLDKFARHAVTPTHISANGTVAGIGLDSYLEEKVFSWSREHGLKEIDITEGHLAVKGVNDQGAVIVETEVYDDDNYNSIAFLYHPERGLLDLGFLENGKDIYLSALNNHMQVVGKAYIDRDSERAFIWGAEQGMRDLTTLIPQGTGWKTLKIAEAINDAGMILGQGLYYGVEHHFLLIPRQ